MSEHRTEVWSPVSPEEPWRWICTCGFWGAGYLNYDSAREAATHHERNSR